MTYDSPVRPDRGVIHHHLVVSGRQTSPFGAVRPVNPGARLSKALNISSRCFVQKLIQNWKRGVRRTCLRARLVGVTAPTSVNSERKTYFYRQRLRQRLRQRSPTKGLPNQRCFRNIVVFPKNSSVFPEKKFVYFSECKFVNCPISQALCISHQASR